MTDFRGEPLERACHYAKCSKKSSMAIARDDLARYRLDMQTQGMRHVFFDARIDIGKGADGARNGADGNLLTRRDQARPRTRKFRMESRQFETKRGRLRMDTVAPADRE